MKVFQYVAFLNPADRTDQPREAPSLLVDITTVLARDENEARLLAGRALPEHAMSRLGEVVIAVRPF